MILGLILGLPTLRLRAEYLAIVTIAAGEVLRVLLRSGGEDSLTGGVFGHPGLRWRLLRRQPVRRAAASAWGRLAYSERSLWVMVVGWSLVALTTVLVSALVRSPWGRVLRAIREDEDAARSLGKNVFRFKLQSLVLGGVIGALAGMLLAIDRQSVQPGQRSCRSSPSPSSRVVILGGAGTRLGPVVGAIVYWFVIQFTDRFLRETVEAGWVSDETLSSERIAGGRFVLVGLLLMVLIVFRPQGILGKRQEVLLERE